MRKTALIAGLLLLSTCTGCAMPEFLFAALGNYYSGGGYTLEEKRLHYQRQVEAYRYEDLAKTHGSLTDTRFVQ